MLAGMRMSFRREVPPPAAAAPLFGSASYSRGVPENTAAGTNIGAAVSATDADGDTLSYSLGGTDGGTSRSTRRAVNWQPWARWTMRRSQATRSG